MAEAKAYTLENLPHLVAMIYLEDAAQQLEAATAIQKLLCVGKSFLEELSGRLSFYESQPRPRPRPRSSSSSSQTHLILIVD